VVDTLWADVSEFQPAVDDRYLYRFIAFRSNDGTYRDHHLATNLVWAKKAADAGRITGFMVYLVWEPNWLATVQDSRDGIGVPHRQMALMIDVETWGGKLSGDQSAGINLAREYAIRWLGKHMSRLDRIRKLHRKRVVIYGNAFDLAVMYPEAKRGDARIVLANYAINPPFKNKIAHQYTDHGFCPPFGYCDMNSADGLSPEQFASALGLQAARQHRPRHAVKRHPAKARELYLVRSGDTLGSIARRHHTTWQRLARANQLRDPNKIYVGQRLQVG
jgi:hypothetical protein